MADGRLEDKAQNVAGTSRRPALAQAMSKPSLSRPMAAISETSRCRWLPIIGFIASGRSGRRWLGKARSQPMPSAADVGRATGLPNASKRRQACRGGNRAAARAIEIDRAPLPESVYTLCLTARFARSETRPIFSN